MLEHLGENEAARRVMEALDAVCHDGPRRVRATSAETPRPSRSATRSPSGLRSPRPGDRNSPALEPGADRRFQSCPYGELDRLPCLSRLLERQSARPRLDAQRI